MQELFYPPHSPYLQPSRHNEMSVTYKELGLSLRQGEILGHILEGLPNKRIAQALSLTESTVKEHITGILVKLHAANRVEVITKLRGRRVVREL